MYFNAFKNGLLSSLVWLFFLYSADLSSSTYAIVGGVDNGYNDGYISLVSPTGIMSFPTGLNEAVLSSIYGVAINNSGAAVIGGSDQAGLPFFTLISPSGKTVIPASGPNSPIGAGQITTVAINSKGAAMIGGTQSGSNIPYASLVSPTGNLTGLSGSLPTGTGSIDAVAINDTGYAIIGGSDSGLLLAYVGLVNPSGYVTPITAGSQPLPSGYGEIFDVAINASKSAIIGGYDNGFTTPYVALVSPAGQTSTIIGDGTPAGDGRILSVAINQSGNAIIGGLDHGFQDAYAALISSSGVSTALNGSAFPSPGTGSQINSVAINNSGAAVIGGIYNDSADPYAALVFPNGTIVSLSGDVPKAGGFIESVDINEAGVAIIGGSDNNSSELYIALVSPSGIATKLSGSALPKGSGLINSVAIGSVVPKSWGPGSSFANTMFVFSSDLLPNHIRWHKKEVQEEINTEFGLLADASPSVTHKVDAAHPHYGLWGTLFGDYAHQKKDHTIPSWTQWIGGAFLGFDYWGLSNMLFGCGTGYAYSHATTSEEGRFTNSNQEFLTFYGSWIQHYFYIDWALWGGFYQLSNERFAIAPIKATADTQGWLALPHIELGFPFSCRWDNFTIAPFGMIDWANNWQNHVHEHGKSGLNLIIPCQYTSVLRSEVGLRFFQIFCFTSGDLLLEEKGSFVNKTPFHTAPASTFFIGSISSFTIDIFNNRMQNLGTIQFGLEFIPRRSKWPYAAINYQGEFGSTFQSHYLSLETGKDF